MSQQDTGCCDIWARPRVLSAAHTPGSAATPRVSRLAYSRQAKLTVTRHHPWGAGAQLSALAAARHHAAVRPLPPGLATGNRRSVLSRGVCRRPLCAPDSDAGCHSGEPQHTSTLCWPQAARTHSQNDPAAAVLPTPTSYERRRPEPRQITYLDPRSGRCASLAESDLSTGSNEQSGSPLR